MILSYISFVRLVAPLAGAWIEMSLRDIGSGRQPVAPLAGAWIEIFPATPRLIVTLCRSPRGSVD